MHREDATYFQYASHLKTACLLLSHPVDWAAGDAVGKIGLGIKKSCTAQKAARLATSREMVTPITPRMADVIEERVFSALAWVFMLRANAGGSGLVFAETPDVVSNLFRPIS